VYLITGILFGSVQFSRWMLQVTIPDVPVEFVRGSRFNTKFDAGITTANLDAFEIGSNRSDAKISISVQSDQFNQFVRIN